MTHTTRRALLATTAAVGASIAGCLGDATDDWAVEDTVPATAATLYQGPNCNCCEVYADYLDDHLDGGLEVVVTEDLGAIKTERGIDVDLHSCHTVDFDGYVVEGHVPVEVIVQLFEEGPDLDGIALPGMPSGSPGMGGSKDETWTIYGFSADESPTVYTEL
ncbi:metal-binding protein [Halalkaliarchaeum desulfuricum]|uniref:Metal-binding protein n=1 Tax=Halalkaliarchaeum desulfuricum TaxID=2055893 RepID=A0A343TNQ5_9EURY|nr:DUF411 domain-containing protein [Halalkaliarchaeum desulfuricum]AUX10727.1 metal-binding protein [Halalkaliarchaeum desulfuricum]